FVNANRRFGFLRILTRYVEKLEVVMLCCHAKILFGSATAASGRAGQRVDDGLDRVGLRLDQPELAHVMAEVVEDVRAPDAAGGSDVAFQQVVQVVPVRF